jgi:hypothetical protein
MTDPRVIFLQRAHRVTALWRAGRWDIDQAFNGLVDPFLEIVGPAARLCRLRRSSVATRRSMVRRGP